MQTQLRRHLVDAILDGRLASDSPLPSCRRLAHALGVSRNTVVLAYQALTDEGFLVSRERVGYFVNADIQGTTTSLSARSPNPSQDPSQGRPEYLADNWNAPDWRKRLRVRPSEQSRIQKPQNWRHYTYPFIYGQADPELFPVAAWRLCSRQALGVQAIHRWTVDSVDADDPLLIEEVRTRVLPRRAAGNSNHPGLPECALSGCPIARGSQDHGRRRGPWLRRRPQYFCAHRRPHKTDPGR